MSHNRSWMGRRGPPGRKAAVRRLAALVVLVGAVTPACSTTIGIAMPPAAASARPLLEGLADQAKARDVTVAFAHAPDGAGEAQIAQVRQFIAAKVDALLVAPVAASVSAPLARLAQEADIPLVFLDDGPPDAWSFGRIASIRPHDLVAGRLQMRKLAQMLGGSGRLALISGHAAQAGSALRVQGVREVLAGFPGLRTVAEGAAEGDRGKARALVAGWLAGNVAMDAIAASNDEMALGAAEAVEAAGIPAGRILIGGVDATPDGLAAMQRKRLAVTVYQDAGLQGRRAVDAALALIRREPVRRLDWMPVELITDRMSTTHFAQ